MAFAKSRNNNLVHITEVDRGDTSCKCLECGSALIVVKGAERSHHFRHGADTNCTGESVIHKAAKQIILERKQITLPNNNTFCLDSAADEVQLHGIVADILGFQGDRELVIEIFYRHKVGCDKIEKIKNANIRAIEIDLSDLTPDHLDNMDSFWSCINDPNRVTWINETTPQQETIGLLNLTPQEIEQARRIIELMQAARINELGQKEALPRMALVRQKQYTPRMSVKTINKGGGRF